MLNYPETPFTDSSSPTVSLVRSGSFMSSPRPNPIKKNIDGFGGGSDDSMHEKYFKSVENTPVSRRRNQSLTNSPSQQQKHSSDSSPHSPLSPKKNVSLHTIHTSQQFIHIPQLVHVDCISESQLPMHARITTLHTYAHVWQRTPHAVISVQIIIVLISYHTNTIFFFA